MTRYHNGSNGPSHCSARPGHCPLGGDHYDSEEEAQSAFESRMDENTISSLRKTGRKKAKEYKERTYDNYERDEFFSRPDQLDNYTLIDPETGTVFGTNSVVMEEPDEEDLEDFYEEPENYYEDDSDQNKIFTNEDKYKVRLLEDADSLDDYKNPVIVEMETGTIVDARDVHAVNHGKYEIDFDEILESQSEASAVAHEQGFRLWR